MEKAQVEEFVYVRCLTESATIIDRRNYQPQTAPVEIPLKEYKASKAQYDFYEAAGTLGIEKDAGTKAFAIAARQAKAAQRIAEETDAQGVLPPASIEIPTRGVPSAVRAEIAKGRMRRASIDPAYCRAKRGDGLQCHGKPREGRDFCGLHSKMVINGAEVKDMDGNIVTLEDVE